MSVDFLSNLGRVIDQVSKEKGVSRQIIVTSVIEGILMAVRKKYGTYRDIEAKYNEETGEVELFEFKKVVPDEDFEDEQIEIKYTEAKALDPEVQMEDQIGTRLELKSLGRIDAQVAKQIIMQNLREEEHKIIFNEFEKRKGEIASGVVRRADDYTIVVDLDKTEAYIPRPEQIPEETYKSGDRIQGYILEVRQRVKGPQIIMSRAHPNYLIKLFESEVPEVYEGIVKIVAAAREPGQRAKMSVYSTDPAVHPVGACVGIKGSRVQNITQELKGERVDIIVWEENSVQYICNALAPAKIVRVLVDEDNKQMQVIVPDDQLSLAIGKKGQNVRLAVKLTGWNLDLFSETQATERKRQAIFNLCLLPGMNETMAESIYQYGFSSFKEIAEATVEDVKDIPGYDKESEAEKLILESRNLLGKYEQEGKEIPVLKEEEKISKPTGADLKEQAEEILKKELAQLSGGSRKGESDEKEEVKVEGEELESDAEKKEAKVEAEVKEESIEKEKAETKGGELKASEKKEVKAEEVKGESDEKEVKAEKKKTESGDKKKKVKEKSSEKEKAKAKPSEKKEVKKKASSQKKESKGEKTKPTEKKEKNQGRKKSNPKN